MDGHDSHDKRGERAAPPVGILEALRARDPVELALRALGEREGLRPVAVPSVPLLSDALDALVNARTPSSVPSELQREFDAYCAARDARINAKAENRRRLRSSLWAEQCLRNAGRPEHAQMRAFNRQAWGVAEPAPHDFAMREQLVEKHA